MRIEKMTKRVTKIAQIHMTPDRKEPEEKRTMPPKGGDDFRELFEEALGKSKER